MTQFDRACLLLEILYAIIMFYAAPSSFMVTPQARNATITWTSAGSSFSVTYRVRGGTSSTTKSANETTIVLTRLSPAISYDVDIRGIDPMGRQGEIGTTMFTTLPAG